MDTKTCFVGGRNVTGVYPKARRMPQTHVSQKIRLQLELVENMIGRNEAFLGATQPLAGHGAKEQHFSQPSCG